MDKLTPEPEAPDITNALNQALNFGRLEKQWLDFARLVEQNIKAPTLGQADSLEGRITQLGRILSRFGDELSLPLSPATVDLPTTLKNPTQEDVWTYWRKLCAEIIPWEEPDPKKLKFKWTASHEMEQAEGYIAQTKKAIEETEAKIASLTTPGELAGRIAGEVVQTAGALLKNASMSMADPVAGQKAPEFEYITMGERMAQINSLKVNLGEIQRRLVDAEEQFASRDWDRDIKSEQAAYARQYSEAAKWRETYEKAMASNGLQIWERLSKTCAVWLAAYPKPTLLSFSDLSSNLPIPNWPLVQDTWEGRALAQNLERNELRLDQAKRLAPRMFGVCYECRHLMVQGTSGDRLVASCAARVLDAPKRPEDWPYKTWTNIQELPRDCCLSSEPLPAASLSEPAE